MKISWNHLNSIIFRKTVFFWANIADKVHEVWGHITNKMRRFGNRGLAQLGEVRTFTFLNGMFIFELLYIFREPLNLCGRKFESWRGDVLENTTSLVSSMFFTICSFSLIMNWGSFCFPIWIFHFSVLNLTRPFLQFLHCYYESILKSHLNNVKFTLHKLYTHSVEISGYFCHSDFTSNQLFSKVLP